VESLCRDYFALPIRHRTSHIADQASSRRGHLRSRQRRKATNCSLKSADDQRALHARLAVAWQITTEFVFPGLVENDVLSSNLAGLYFQAKIEGRQNNAMLRFSPAVIENERYRTPRRDLNLCRHKFEFRGSDHDFEGLRLVRGPCACARTTDNIPNAARTNGIKKVNGGECLGSFSWVNFPSYKLFSSEIVSLIPHYSTGGIGQMAGNIEFHDGTFFRNRIRSKDNGQFRRLDRISAVHPLRKFGSEFSIRGMKQPGH